MTRDIKRVRAFFKRLTNIIDLNKRDENISRSKKIRRLDKFADQITRLIIKYRDYQFSKDFINAIDNIDKKISDREFA